MLSFTFLAQLVVVLVVLGLVYWLLMQLPIAEPFRSVIKVVVIIFLILWLLSLVGLLPGTRIRLGSLESRVGVEPTFTSLQLVSFPEDRDMVRVEGIEPT